MALTQNPNQNQNPPSPPSQDSKISAPEGPSKSDLRKKIEEGRKIAEQHRQEMGTQKEEGKREAPLPPSAAISEQKPETTPTPGGQPISPTSPSQEIQTEHPAVTKQREIARQALEEKREKEAELQETKKEVQGTGEEVEQLSQKVGEKAGLAAERVEKGRPLAREAAKRAHLTSEKVEKASQDLKDLTKTAQVQKKEAEKAGKDFQREVQKYQGLKAADPYHQKEALKQAREARGK